MADPINRVFVYGTLMQGESRGNKWPYTPLHIESATIEAELHDLGPYPAILHGTDVVAGQLWHFAADDMKQTLKVLDAIEGFRQPGEPNLYVRKVFQCRTCDAVVHLAYTYFYADENKLSSCQRILANEDGLCRWSGT